MSLYLRESRKCLFCHLLWLPLTSTTGSIRPFTQTTVKARGKSQVYRRLPTQVRTEASPRSVLPNRKSSDSGSYQDESRHQSSEGTFVSLSGNRSSSNRFSIGGHTTSARIDRGDEIRATPQSHYAAFGKLLLDEYHKFFRKAYENGPDYWGVSSPDILIERLKAFENELHACIQLAERGTGNATDNPLFSRFRRKFVTEGFRNLGRAMEFSFRNFLSEPKLSGQEITNQDNLADLRYPIDWYPATRMVQRTIHLHVGPTNSGKTYHALKRLEQAKSGIYAGPLRLLAHEVYTRFNAKGKQCALVTGEERRMPPNGEIAPMSSCTVEMVPLNKQVEVAVIDEIQMIADRERGWAWTQAFLGVQASEVHLCGELRTIELVSDICAATGDNLIVHEYERLSPLSAEKFSLDGNLSKLRKGDAVIVFSRVGIHAMKSNIEQNTGRRCAVVYGSLPPETRAQQAELFNDPDNDYDFLVASDAVGMGLNLSIKRVVFESVAKHDGVSYRVMEAPQIKQIAGRAGRFKTARQATESGKDNIKAITPSSPAKKDPTNGLVTTLERADMRVLRNAMAINADSIKTAGVKPPNEVIARYATYFPKGTTFSYILKRLQDRCRLDEMFHLCSLRDSEEIADIIETFDIPLIDRITFTAAPVSLRDPGFVEVIKEFAQCLASQSGGNLLELKSLELELLDIDIHDYYRGSKEYLRKAETLHKAITLYLWLSYQFTGVFGSQALAFHVKSLVEEKIDQCLAEAKFDPARNKAMAYARKKALELGLAEEKQKQKATEVLGEREEFSEEETALDEESHALNPSEDDSAIVHDTAVVESVDENAESTIEQVVPIPPEEPIKSNSVSV